MASDHRESFARFNFPAQIVNFLLDAQINPENPDQIVEFLVQLGLARIVSRVGNQVTLDFQNSNLNADCVSVAAPTENSQSSLIVEDQSSTPSDSFYVELDSDFETSADFDANHETVQPLSPSSSGQVLLNTVPLEVRPEDVASFGLNEKSALNGNNTQPITGNLICEKSQDHLPLPSSSGGQVVSNTATLQICPGGSQYFGLNEKSDLNGNNTQPITGNLICEKSQDHLPLPASSGEQVVSNTATLQIRPGGSQSFGLNEKSDLNGNNTQPITGNLICEKSQDHLPLPASSGEQVVSNTATLQICPGGSQYFDLNEKSALNGNNTQPITGNLICEKSQDHLPLPASSGGQVVSNTATLQIRPGGSQYFGLNEKSDLNGNNTQPITGNLICEKSQDHLPLPASSGEQVVSNTATLQIRPGGSQYFGLNEKSDLNGNNTQPITGNLICEKSQDHLPLPASSGEQVVSNTATLQIRPGGSQYFDLNEKSALNGNNTQPITGNLICEKSQDHLPLPASSGGQVVSNTATLQIRPGGSQSFGLNEKSALNGNNTQPITGNLICEKSQDHLPLPASSGGQVVSNTATLQIRPGGSQYFGLNEKSDLNGNNTQPITGNLICEKSQDHLPLPASSGEQVVSNTATLQIRPGGSQYFDLNEKSALNGNNTQPITGNLICEKSQDHLPLPASSGGQVVSNTATLQIRPGGSQYFDLNEKSALNGNNTQPITGNLICEKSQDHLPLPASSGGQVVSNTATLQIRPGGSQYFGLNEKSDLNGNNTQPITGNLICEKSQDHLPLPASSGEQVVSNTATLQIRPGGSQYFGLNEKSDLNGNNTQPITGNLICEKSQDHLPLPASSGEQVVSNTATLQIRPGGSQYFDLNEKSALNGNNTQPITGNLICEKSQDHLPLPASSGGQVVSNTATLQIRPGGSQSFGLNEKSALNGNNTQPITGNLICEKSQDHLPLPASSGGQVVSNTATLQIRPGGSQYFGLNEKSDLNGNNTQPITGNLICEKSQDHLPLPSNSGGQVVSNTATLQIRPGGSQVSTSSRHKEKENVASLANDPQIVELTPQRLLALLNQTVLGQTIVDLAAQGRLSGGRQSDLCGIVAQWHLTHRTKCHSRELEKYAETIKLTFCQEEKEDYYLPSGGDKRNPGGQIYNKINTIKARIKKHKLRDEAHLAEQGSKRHCETIDPKGQEANNWLKLNCDPWSTVIDCWKLSFSVREQYLRKPKSVEDLKATFYWKFICSQFGYQLLDKDYASLTHQAEDEDRSHKWNSTVAGTITFIKNRSLDTLGASLIEVLKNTEATEDLKTTSFLLLLNHILPPLKLKNGFKPSILNGRDDTILFVSSEAEINEKLQALQNRYRDYQLAEAPKLVVFGSETDLNGEFRLYYNDIIYTLPSARRAVDVYIKLCTVLSVQHSRFCKLIFLFISQYVYELPVKERYGFIQKFESFLKANHKQ